MLRELWLGGELPETRAAGGRWERVGHCSSWILLHSDSCGLPPAFYLPDSDIRTPRQASR